MVLVIVAGVFISFVLIVLLRGSAPNVPYQSASDGKILSLGKRPAEQNDSPPTTLSAADENQNLALATLSLEALEGFCRKVIEKLGLDFKSIDRHGHEEFHILARSEKLLMRGDVIVSGHWCKPDGCIGSDTVISFSDMVKAERAMKGIFVTNGFFSEEVMKLNEGANIELIDRNGMTALMHQMGPGLLEK